MSIFMSIAMLTICFIIAYEFYIISTSTTFL